MRETHRDFARRCRRSEKNIEILKNIDFCDGFLPNINLLSIPCTHFFVMVVMKVSPTNLNKNIENYDLRKRHTSSIEMCCRQIFR